MIGTLCLGLCWSRRWNHQAVSEAVITCLSLSSLSFAHHTAPRVEMECWLGDCSRWPYGQFGAPSVCLPCSYGRCTHVHVGPRPATDGERACSRPTYHSLRLTAAAFNCAKRSMPPRFLIRIINYYTHRLGSVCFYDASFALGFTAV